MTESSPKQRKDAKTISISNNSKTTANSRPIILLLSTLRKIMEKLVFSQILNNFLLMILVLSSNTPTKMANSTCTALTQVTDDWLCQIDERKAVVADPLDFGAAFNVIDHELLLEILSAYGFEVDTVI